MANSGECKKLLETAHRMYGHAGAATIISILANQLYIIGAKKTLKGIGRRCVTCRQQSATTLQPQMGVLPSCRTTLEPPFFRTGVDMAGPVKLREGSTRKPVIYKAYLCIFVCMAVKAVHIELCRSLDAQEFQAVFSRFCSRRGTPAEVFSDNGGNFVATAKDMAATAAMKQAQHRFPTVKWHFNPPKAPNFGGLWEAAVKSAKRLMNKMIQPHALRFDELMTTVLCEVEALLNSRPLISTEMT